MTSRNNSRNRRGRNRNNGSNNNKPTSGGQSSGKSAGYQKKTEFKFQLHDSSRKGGYTYKKIFDAIILKIQTTFEGGRYVVTSLRGKVKGGPPAPVRGISQKVDLTEKTIEQESLNRKYDAQCGYYFTSESQFEDNWVKAYGLIFDNYCSNEMKRTIMEVSDYDTRILDDPLELLKEIERLVHVPRKADYPSIALIETLSNIMTIRQGDKEGLVSYLERFKSEKNVVVSLFGTGLLDGHVEKSSAYRDLDTSIADAAARKQAQDAMKTKALAKFWGLLYLRQADQKRYGHLLKEWRQQYANDQRDLYPKDLTATFEVMRTVEVKKEKVEKPKSEKPKVDLPENAESFNQTGKQKNEEITCWCCGKPDEYSNECDLRNKIAKDDWFVNSGVKHYLKGKAKEVNAQVGNETPKTEKPTKETKRTKSEKKVGFVAQQFHQTASVLEADEPDILLDSGSTISVFKDQDYLRDIKDTKRKLVMETNVGSRTISKQGTIPGHGPVWIDTEAISNLLSLNDLVKKGHHVKYDSHVGDWFDVVTKSGVWLQFPADERGLYVKEKMNAIRKRNEKQKTANVNTTIEGFTRREVKRARACRKLMHDLGAPSYSDLKKFLRMNLCRECPVSSGDVDLAMKIFGKDVAVLKGKSVKGKPPVVGKEDEIELPPELVIEMVELAIDVIYVSTEAFLHTVDRKIKNVSVVPLGTAKKVPAKTLWVGLKKVVSQYNTVGIGVSMIHADNEFRAVENLCKKEEIKIEFNFCNPDEHVPDIERENRTLEERFRTEYHRLVFDNLPIQLIRALIARCTFNRNLFVKKEGCSAYFSPHMILKKKNINFEKHLKYSFGSYVIAYQDNNTQTNTPKARGRDSIYLRALNNLQGGHEILDLMTGRVIPRPRVEPVVMTESVKKRIEEMAEKQGVKSLKFLNRYREPLTPVDVAEENASGLSRHLSNTEDDELEFVDSESDEHSAYLPSPDDETGGLLSESDSESEEEIDNDEVADLLQDAAMNDGIQLEVEDDGDMYYVENGIDSGDENDEPDNCDAIPEEEDEVSVPSLAEESVVNERPSRVRSMPERYNPSSGRSYHQYTESKMRSEGRYDEFVREYCDLLKKREEVHNIISNVEDIDDCLEYEGREARLIAEKIQKVFVQQHLLPRAVKVFGPEARKAGKSEVKQLHDRTCFRAMAVAELTRREKERAMEGLLFISQKSTGEHKGRLAYNGKPTRAWVSREDKSSPTAGTESIFITCAVDAAEKRDVMSLDVPNAFIQAKLPIAKVGERIIMKLRGEVVDWLVELDPLAYLEKVVYEKGKKVLYLEVLRALYGMLIASLEWYKKIRADLESIGFEFNPYDGCVANRSVKGKQQTLRLHVDDMLVSCEDKTANDDLHKWCQMKYGKLKPVKCTRGKVHTFLGMELDFKTKPGSCLVKQNSHVLDLIESFGENVKGNSPTPGGTDLFRSGSGGLLDNKSKELFHTCVAKALFISKRSRPDIALVVAVLSGRVREPNADDKRKLRRLVDYLKGTKDLCLVLNAEDGLNVFKWYVDASFATHPDFRSHTGGLLMLGEKGGAVVSQSIKQKVNSRSSTEAELIGVDDMVAKIVWTTNFSKMQGLRPQKTMLFQDNDAAIVLESKGVASTGKRMKHLDIKYFFVKDLVERGDLNIEWCPTASMVADFLTKPLQGKLFLDFRRRLLGDQ